MRHRAKIPVLLATLVIVFLLTPFVDEESRLGGVLLEGILSLVLLGGIYAESGRRRTLSVGLWLAAPALGASWTGTLTGSVALSLTGGLLYGCALGYLLYVLVLDLWSKETVTRHTLSVAVSGYLVLGLVWVFVYHAVLIGDPAAFRGVEFGSGARNALLYFSFTTLTTLGYGDLVPVSPLGRSLANLEAVLGQLYMAVMVARLVGLQIADRTARGPV